MSRFLIRLAGAYISHTRSRDSDTIYAFLELVINGTATPVIYWDGLGWNGQNHENRDWNKGQHFFGTDVRSNVQMYTGNLAPTDRVEVIFNVINSVNFIPSGRDYESAAGAIRNGVCRSSNRAGDSSGWACIFAAIPTILAEWKFADCDGLVAADRVVFTGADLDRLVPNPGNLPAQPEIARSFTWSRNYHGLDSPPVSGSNSNYRIDLALIRTA
jgi:hypothetical protein